MYVLSITLISYNRPFQTTYISELLFINETTLKRHRYAEAGLQEMRKYVKQQNMWFMASDIPENCRGLKR